MLTDRVWTIDMTSRFSEIFESRDRVFELEYDDPDLEDGDVSASMSKEIFEGLAKQVGKTVEELLADNQIPDLPEKEAGDHSDDRDIPGFEDIEVKDVTSEEYPEYFERDKDSGFTAFTDELLKEAERRAKEKSDMFVDEIFRGHEKLYIRQSDSLKELLRELKEKEARSEENT